MPLEADWLGQVPYKQAYEMQLNAHKQRLDGECGDRLMLMEHPLVFTLPRRAKSQNLLVNENFLSRMGAELLPTDRGGEITLHNPGQLVGYLICQLHPGGRDLHGFLRWIESSLIETARSYGIPAERRQGLTGVWVENRKLASIGLAVKRWVTLHGFGLNVSNNLEPFNWIHPCGLEGVEMTSIQKETGMPVDWGILLERIRIGFGAQGSLMEGYSREVSEASISGPS